MKVFDKIEVLIEKHMSKIRAIFILCIIIFSIFICFDFYKTHAGSLDVVIRENLNWESFKETLVVLEALLRKFFIQAPLKGHILFWFAIVVACFLDLFYFSSVLFLYVLLVVLFGLHNEIHVLMQDGANHLISSPCIQIDLVYSDEQMVNFVYKFIEIFNNEFGTDYPIPDAELVSIWILKANGRPSVLIEILVFVYTKYHENILIAKEQARRKKYNPLATFLKGLEKLLKQWFG